MPASPTIAEAVAALKAFAVALPRQPGLLVDLLSPIKIGEPAPAKAIAHLRANPALLPPDLVDLYELMDGCEIRWGFRDPDPLDPEDYEEKWGKHYLEWGEEDGRLQILRLQEVRLKTDLENHYTFFGPGVRSAVFSRSYHSTWLVAYGPDGPSAKAERGHYHPETYARQQGPDYDDQAASAQADVANAQLVFDSYEALIPLPTTVAGYLMQAIAHGGVMNWPLAWQRESKDMDRRGSEWKNSVSRQVERFHAVTGM